MPCVMEIQYAVGYGDPISRGLWGNRFVLGIGEKRIDIDTLQSLSEVPYSMSKGRTTRSKSPQPKEGLTLTTSLLFSYKKEDQQIEHKQESFNGTLLGLGKFIAKCRHRNSNLTSATTNTCSSGGMVTPIFKLYWENIKKFFIAKHVLNDFNLSVLRALSEILPNVYLAFFTISLQSCTSFGSTKISGMELLA